MCYRGVVCVIVGVACVIGGVTLDVVVKTIIKCSYNES